MTIYNTAAQPVMEGGGSNIDWNSPIEEDPMIETPWDAHKNAWKQSGIKKFMPDPLGLFGGGSNEGSRRRQALESRSAQLTRSQWQHFLDVYRPVEQDLLRQAMQTDFSKEGDEAGQMAAASLRSSQGTLSRNLSRVGASMTPEEAAAVRRRANLSMGRATAGAENTARRTLSDTRTNLLRGIVGIGRGVATSATGGIQNAADNAAQQEMALAQGRQNAQNTTLAAGASLAAALIMTI
jgi:hypothetical protein